MSIELKGEENKVMNSVLPKNQVLILERLGVTEEFFSKCFKEVTTDHKYEDKTGAIGVKFKLNGFPAAVSAWWEGQSKTLEQTKAETVYEVLTFLTREDIKQILDKTT